MTIDRANRDAIATALASLMRGDTTVPECSAALAAVEDRLPPPGDDADPYPREVCETYHSVLGRGLIGRDRFRSSAEGWEELRRVVAFLLSDQPYRPPDPGDAVGPAAWSEHLPGRGTAVVHLVVLVAAAVVSWDLGWWVFGAAQVGMFALAWSAFRRKSRQTGEQVRARWFGPFASEADWRAAEPLLRPLRLPAYDPEQHGPAPVRRGERLGRAVEVVGWLVVSAALIVFAPWVSLAAPLTVPVVPFLLPARWLVRLLPVVILAAWPLALLALAAGRRPPPDEGVVPRPDRG